MISPGEICRLVPCHELESWERFWSPPASPVRHGTVISPPLQFQDTPPMQALERYADKLVERLLSDALEAALKAAWSIPCSHVCHMSGSLSRRHSLGSSKWCGGLRLCWTPELHPYSPCHGRLSSSHTSLSVPADDSSLISSAASADALLDVYAEPVCDSDAYAVPVDVVRPVPSRGPRRIQESRQRQPVCSKTVRHRRERQPRSASAGCPVEPIHLTLQEVRQYLHTLYSSGSEASETLDRLSKVLASGEPNNNNAGTCCKNPRNKTPVKNKNKAKESPKKPQGPRMSFPGLKQTLCSMFRLRKLPTPTECLGRRDPPQTTDEVGARLSGQIDPPSPISKPPFIRRALPPLPNMDNPITTPPLPQQSERPSDVSIDFAASIQKVKDYGWYWGPISGEAAERILSDEPDGSFIVRDSSDDYYIFSLTFKLNSIVRHVRIEHDQGNFSFGNTTRFKSHTIVDFIESAVEHSRSGRYLFFLHRRPTLGPMRVQLLHPVSRFKQVQSLQHMCRFVILKLVRRDLIPNLPLPRRVLEYLSTQHYYSEQIIDEDSSESPLS